LTNNGQDSIHFKNSVPSQKIEKEISPKIIETTQSHSYLHNLDTSGLTKYLKYPNVDTLILSYCNRRLSITDNNETIEFLEMISQKNDKFFPLYFRIFNNIIENSDGAVSELMGPYCFRFVVNYPNEVLKHFMTNREDLKLYSMFLGAEFNFKEYGSSNLKMDFEEFKKSISQKVDLANIEIKTITDIFYSKIDSTKKTMN
jgi:hypothetical protein